MIYCKNCGRGNEIKKDLSKLDDFKCSNCGSHLIEQKDNCIVLSCEDCGAYNNVHYQLFEGWNCKSCLHKNKHPSTIPISGNGNSFGKDFQKTTINIPSFLMKEFNLYLEQININSPIKIKRGEFIRLLLMKEFKLLYKRSE